MVSYQNSYSLQFYRDKWENLKPMYPSEGKASLILFTAQDGKTTVQCFPRFPQHYCCWSSQFSWHGSVLVQNTPLSGLDYTTRLFSSNNPVCLPPCTPLWSHEWFIWKLHCHSNHVKTLKYAFKVHHVEANWKCNDHVYVYTAFFT